MTKQAELKQQAYASDLKSRALSILIYLIDRSNKDLTCFPSIPTIAEQLHISVSTVKRALKELTDAGYIQKKARFRERNRGQSSNLYTLLFVEQEPVPKNDNSLVHEDNIVPGLEEEPCEHKVEVMRITFSTLKSQKQEQKTAAEAENLFTPTIPLAQKKATATPVHFKLVEPPFHHLLIQIKQNAERLLLCIAPSFQWTGVEFILHPP